MAEETGPLGAARSSAARDVPTATGGDARPAVDRPAAAAARPAARHQAVPRRAVVVFVVVILAALAIVTVVDHFVSSGPLPPTAFPQEGRGPVGGVAAPAGSSELHASLAELIGLTKLHGSPEPQWSLTDVADGRTVGSRSLLHHVVVLTFADATCTDICPVLGAELGRADQLLGRAAGRVTFVTVNTDPLATGGSKAPILSDAALSSLGNWQFLSGTVAQLDPVWKTFGISITVNRRTRRVSHNDLMYFISPQGKMVWSAIPFANESSTGAFSLSKRVADRVAQGIAAYAGRLAGTP